MNNKTLTLNLTDAEMATLETLCEKKHLTKAALLRQCLRLYQVVETRLQAGEKLFFEDVDKKQSEVMMI